MTYIMNVKRSVQVILKMEDGRGGVNMSSLLFLMGIGGIFLFIVVVTIIVLIINNNKHNKR